MKSLEERFWSKVTKGKEDECWEWKEVGRDSGGYGRLQISGRCIHASRISYVFAYGEIPNGLSVCHTCDNPACVNPKHLFLGTHQDNMNDREEKGRGFHPKGEASSNAKITENDVKEIKRLRNEEGLSQQKISNLFNIKQREISNILSGKRWGHLK